MRPIQINEEQKVLLLDDFKKFLDKLRSNEDSIRYDIKISKSLEKQITKPTLFFTKLATDKMVYLVDKCDKEVAWHGLVVYDEEQSTYVVEDIIVYPQTATSVTVTTDDSEIAGWFNSLDDDTFFKLRLQGHSHVNMSVSPSSTDTTYYNQLLQNLGDDDYYIFMILNKKNSIFVNIYDYAQNVIFETTDITIQFEEELDPYKEWYEESIKMIKEVKSHSSKGKNKNDKNGYFDFSDFSDYSDYPTWWRDRYGHL